MSIELTPEGDYAAKITSWQFGRNGKGNPEFDLKVLVLGSLVVDGDLEGGIDEFEAGPLRRTVPEYITSKTVDRFKRDLKSIGYDGDYSGQSLTPGQAKSFDFCQAGPNDDGVILVNCKHDEYLGKVRERWTIVTRRLDKMGMEDLSQFATMVANSADQGDQTGRF